MFTTVRAVQSVSSGFQVRSIKRNCLEAETHNQIKLRIIFKQNLIYKSPNLKAYKGSIEMAPKKRNGFMMFVSEWRRKHSEGRRMTVDKCGQIWKNMTAQERGPFIALAKDLNTAPSQEMRCNCFGQLISDVKKEEVDTAALEMQKKRITEHLVLKGKEQQDLENTKFTFVAFNYFIKSNSNEIYIPAEFAACQFSLKTGRSSLFHSHINPGQITFGQASNALDHSRSTHQLPIPPNALGEADIGKLYKSIVDFLRSCQASVNRNEPLVVFTSTELQPVVEGCFKYLESDTDEPLCALSICDISYLFYVLKNEVLDIADKPSDPINKYTSDKLFQNDFFEYSIGISCQFHEDNDHAKYCVQSMVSRWCYMFCDYMCGDLAIKVLPGKHMPPKTDTMFKETQLTFSRKDQLMPNTEISSSFSSVQSHESDHERKPDRKWNYEPKLEREPVIVNHSAFSANLSAAEDFQVLGSRRPLKRVAMPHSSDPRIASRNKQVLESKWSSQNLFTRR